jgi:GST-like protein
MPPPILFYYHPTPNPSKIALMLEETGLAYEMFPIDISRGDQHSEAFRTLNPNEKVPVIVDCGITVFDSSAILLYLAKKSGRFGAGTSDAAQAELHSWLMFIASGIGPFTGQAIHFRHYAPPGQEYSASRYEFEAARHWRIIDERLAKRRYMLGDDYTIADISLWGWCRGLRYLLGDAAWERFEHVGRFFEAVNGRPAARRVEQLASSHPFKKETDSETRASLFRHVSPGH